MNTIKNKDGKVLGFIRESGKETVALSSSGKVIGVYNSTTNLTKDGNLKIISTGNTVVSQLFR
jgi:hypothetical protein